MFTYRVPKAEIGANPHDGWAGDPRKLFAFATPYPSSQNISGLGPRKPQNNCQMQIGNEGGWGGAWNPGRKEGFTGKGDLGGRDHSSLGARQAGDCEHGEQQNSQMKRCP